MLPSFYSEALEAVSSGYPVVFLVLEDGWTGEPELKQATLVNLSFDDNIRARNPCEQTRLRFLCEFAMRTREALEGMEA